MLQGLMVVGVLFGLGVLMVVGVHSAMRDLLARQLYPRHLYQGDDLHDAPSAERRSIRIADAISGRSRV
jgi:hypothetical protein